MLEAPDQEPLSRGELARWETIINNTAQLVAGMMLETGGLELVLPKQGSEARRLYHSFPSSWSRNRMLFTLDELVPEQLVIVELLLDEDARPLVRVNREHRGGLSHVLGTLAYPEEYGIHAFQEFEQGLANVVSTIWDVPARLTVQVADSRNRRLIESWRAEVLGHAMLDADASGVLLPPGHYQVSVDAGEGFEAINTGLILNAGEDRVLDVALDRMGVLLVEAPGHATIVVGVEKAVGSGQFLVAPDREFEVVVSQGRRERRQRLSLEPGERRMVRIRLPLFGDGWSGSRWLPQWGKDQSDLVGQAMAGAN